MSNKSIWAGVIVALIVVIGLWYFLDHRNLQLVPTSELENAASSTPATDASTTPAATTSQSANTTTTAMQNFAHTITIQTNKGTIVFQTYDADAPNTVKNFLTLTDKGFYNGLIFHRVIPGFMIQGGDPTGTGRGGPGYTFADELNPNTPSYQAGYVPGTVAMANAGPNTNGSQFFIMQGNQALPHDYTIFGKVISGMDVVNAIAAVPTDSNDKPLSDVTMTKVTEAATQ